MFASMATEVNIQNLDADLLNGCSRHLHDVDRFPEGSKAGQTVHGD